MANDIRAKPTDLHRIFIQSLLSRRVVSEVVLVELYKRALTACRAVSPDSRSTHQGDKQGARAFVKEINRILDESGMQMEMRSVKHEEDRGKDIWALVNIDPAEEGAFMTDYEPLQITYFRVVVNAIIISYPANSVGANQALSLTSSLPGQMTKSAADTLLSSFVARGWLFKSERGRYSLAPRAILELENWLNSEHEEYVQKCGRCKKIVFHGIICGNDECEAHIHKSCYTILHNAPRPACQVCNVTFAETAPKPLGEKAVSRSADAFSQVRGKRKRPSAAANGAGPSRRRWQGEDDDEDEEDVDFEEEEGEGVAAEGTDNEEGVADRRDSDKSSGVLAVGNGPTGWKVASDRPKKRGGTVIPNSEDEAEDDE